MTLRTPAVSNNKSRSRAGLLTKTPAMDGRAFKKARQDTPAPWVAAGRNPGLGIQYGQLEKMASRGRPGSGRGGTKRALDLTKTGAEYSEKPEKKARHSGVPKNKSIT